MLERDDVRRGKKLLDKLATICATRVMHLIGMLQGSVLGPKWLISSTSKTMKTMFVLYDWLATSLGCSTTFARSQLGLVPAPPPRSRYSSNPVQNKRCSNWMEWIRWNLLNSKFAPSKTWLKVSVTKNFILTFQLFIFKSLRMIFLNFLKL